MSALLSFTGGACACAALLHLRATHRPPRGGLDAHSGVENDLLATIAQYRRVFGLAIRRAFHLDFSYTHLNHGSFGTAPRVVTAAAHASALSIEAFPDDSFRRTARGKYDDACATVAAFVGAEPDSIVLIENATAGVNAVMRSLKLDPGDCIVITDNTYGACRNAALDTAERTGAIVIIAQLSLPVVSPQQLVSQLEAALRSAPSGRVKFVLLDHITSPTALVMPLKQMIPLCASFGAAVMVDGAHAPGQLPLALDSLGCQWYTGNLHKWCFAPKGVAFLYAAPSVREATQPLVVSHLWKRDFRSRFYMQGTVDYSRYFSVPVALSGFIGGVLGCGTGSSYTTSPASEGVPVLSPAVRAGLLAMRDYNSALVRAGAQLCVRAWGTRTLLPAEADEALATPFLVSVETPLDFARFLTAGRAPACGDAEKEAALNCAAAKADSGINEAVASAVFRASRVQSQFFFWEVGGVGRMYVRLSANVYNCLEDYERLAAAVLAVAAQG